MTRQQAAWLLLCSKREHLRSCTPGLWMPGRPGQLHGARSVWDGCSSLSLFSGRRPCPMGSHPELSTLHHFPHLPPWALWALSQPHCRHCQLGTMLSSLQHQGIHEGGEGMPSACLLPSQSQDVPWRCSDSPATQMRAGQQLGTERL